MKENEDIEIARIEIIRVIQADGTDVVICSALDPHGESLTLLDTLGLLGLAEHSFVARSGNFED